MEERWRTWRHWGKEIADSHSKENPFCGCEGAEEEWQAGCKCEGLHKSRVGPDGTVNSGREEREGSEGIL